HGVFLSQLDRQEHSKHCDPRVYAEVGVVNRPAVAVQVVQPVATDLIVGTHGAHLCCHPPVHAPDWAAALSVCERTRQAAKVGARRRMWSLSATSGIRESSSLRTGKRWPPSGGTAGRAPSACLPVP